MKLPKLIILIVVLISSQFTFGQTTTRYVIQLGNSSESTYELSYLSDISNVYFQASTNLDNKKVTLGSFSDLQKAEAITQNLRGVSFPNAYIEPLAEEKGKDVFVIKLADFDSHDEIDWSRYQLNKKIYTSIENGRYKIITGIFADYDAALPLHNKLFQLGFINAEVVKINSIYLHEVNEMDIAYQRTLHTRSQGAVKEFTAKGATASISISQEESEENIPPIVNRVALSKSIAPAINEKLARVSVKNLQSILSIYGNYASEPNGIYDAKTANSYYATVQLTPSLKEFSAAVESKAHITSGYFTDWSDVELLLNISEHITGTSKEHFGDAELKALVSLYNNPKVLSSTDAQKVSDWMIKTNAQMQNMKAEGRLDSATLQAYMLVSTKVQVLLEDYFLNKGFLIDEATNLAKATMYAMLVGSFQAI